MASADVYTSHGGGGVGEAYTCDTPVSTFTDACAVCVWLEQAVHSALCSRLVLQGLTLKALIYFYINQETKGFSSI